MLRGSCFLSLVYKLNAWISTGLLSDKTVSSEHLRRAGRAWCSRCVRLNDSKGLEYNTTTWWLNTARLHYNRTAENRLFGQNHICTDVLLLVCIRDENSCLLLEISDRLRQCCKAKQKAERCCKFTDESLWVCHQPIKMIRTDSFCEVIDCLNSGCCAVALSWCLAICKFGSLVFDNKQWNQNKYTCTAVHNYHNAVRPLHKNTNFYLICFLNKWNSVKWSMRLC